MLKFDVIHLKSRDVQAAAAWYRDFLGAEVIESFENTRGKTVRTRLQGTAINITQQPDADSLPGVPLEEHIGIEHIGFRVDDLDKTLADMRSRGAEVIGPVYTGDRNNRWFFLRAPDGVRIEIVQD